MRMFHLCAALSIFVAPWVAAETEDATRLREAGEFLNENRVHSGDGTRPESYESTHATVAATADPQSHFGYIVFSIARHSDRLLASDQAEQLDALIAARQNAAVNWHDVRNIVRVHAAIAMWNYAAMMPGNTDELARARQQWEAWTEMRIAFMFQEFVDKERFQRAAWNILSDAQRADLLSGKWDDLLKRSTGHKRLFSADKQITRVLGRAGHKAAFEKAAAQKNAAWQAMWQRYQAAALLQRQREFSMQIADESFAVASWQEEYAPAFRAFATAECDAIRELLHAGYELDAAQLETLRKHRETLRAELVTKYFPARQNFLRRLKVVE